MHTKRRLLLLALLCTGAVATVRAGDITYNFDTDPAGKVDVVGSNSDINRWVSKGGNPATGGFLAITFAQTYFNSGILFPDLDPGKVVTAFTFDCDLRVGNPSTGDRAADGFSISFARAGDPVLTAWADSDPLRGFRGDQAGVPTCTGCENAALPETGTSTGISISFDTWQGNTLPDGADVEGIVVVVDNVTVLRHPEPTRNGACADATSLQTGARDAAYWAASGDPLQPDGWKTLCWQPLHVQLDPDGKLTVAWKGTTILDKYQTSYFPTPGQLVFAGRTGGSTEQTHVDNIHLVTTAVPGETQPPTVPTNLKAAEIGARRVVLNWSPSVDQPDPQVRVAYQVEKDGAIIANTVTSTNYEDRVNLNPASSHTYRVRAFDLNQNKSDWASVSVTTVAEAPSFGWYYGQIYDNLSGAAWSDLTAAIADPKFPNKPDRQGAYFNGISFGAPSFGNTFGDNLLVRFAGVLVPTETAKYRFFVRSDDASGLWLNATGATLPDVVNTTPVAQEQGCCAAFAEPGADDNGDGTFPTSDPISLTAGQSYGFVYLVKEGGGGDWGQVAWRKEGDTTPAASLPPISGAFLKDPGMGDPLGASVTITNPPANTTIVANQPLKLSVQAATASPWTTAVVYQWYKDGKPIINANSASYGVAVASTADAGQYKVIVSVPGKDATSSEATVTVNPDTQAPTIVSVHGSDTFDTVTVTFSEPVSSTAESAGSYTLTGGLTVSKATRVDAYTIKLTTSKQAESTVYTLTAAGVKDNAGNAVASSADWKSFGLTTGYMKFEYYVGMDSGTGVSLLTDWIAAGHAPNMVAYTTSFDSRPIFGDDSHEQYGAIISGWIVPKETAAYTFFIRSDDASEFWLSTDDTAAKAVLIAQQTGCCNAFTEPDSASPGPDSSVPFTSAPITLKAGTKYFAKLLYKEGGGGDYGQVAWRKAGDTTAAGNLTPMPGTVLAAYYDPMVKLQGASVAFGSAATLKAPVNPGVVPFAYQWRKNQTAIAGATSPTLTIPSFTTADVALYEVVLTMLNGSTTTSGPALLAPAGTLFIEAEDVNYNKGSYVKDQAIGMTGAYIGDAYANLGASTDKGVDWNADYGGGQPYRANTKGIDADKQNAQYGSDARGDFDVLVNNVVGWNDAGEWYNYTRQFPTPEKSYNVIGRLASGGSAINIQMDEVTTGATTTTQTFRKLGAFRPGRATAGWDSMEFFPLVDDAGNPAVVTGLSGEKTIRVTMQPSSAEDMDYFMFFPATSAPAGPNFTSVSLTAQGMKMEWTGGVIESSPAVNGPWKVEALTSPATVPVTDARKFYRVHQ